MISALLVAVMISARPQVAGPEAPTTQRTVQISNAFSIQITQPDPDRVVVHDGSIPRIHVRACLNGAMRAEFDVRGEKGLHPGYVVGVRAIDVDGRKDAALHTSCNLGASASTEYLTIVRVKGTTVHVLSSPAVFGTDQHPAGLYLALGPKRHHAIVVAEPVMDGLPLPEPKRWKISRYAVGRASLKRVSTIITRRKPCFELPRSAVESVMPKRWRLGVQL